MSGGGSIRPERSLEELLAYARIMERESAERYAELAEIMALHNNHEVSELFKRMSEIEWLHVQNVDELSREFSVVQGAVQPGVGDRLRGAELPQSGDMHYMHAPHQVLKLAHQSEQNALDFYQRLAESATDGEVRAAALRLAAEEEAHLRELDAWLSRYPEPQADWAADPDPPNAID